MSKPKLDLENYDLVLVDGNALARAAFDPSHRNATVDRVLSRVLTLSGGARTLVAWDVASDRRRREIYPAYKESRRKNPWVDFERFDKERRTLRGLLSGLGIDQVFSPGWEADDVIGTLSRRATGRTVVVSRDRDLLQTLSGRTDVYLEKGRDAELYNLEGFRKKRGFDAQKLSYWKAARGDAGDDVPGVPGIGDVTADLLFRVYCNPVATVLTGCGSEPARRSGEIDVKDLKVARRAVEKLRANLEILRISLELVKLHDVPIRKFSLDANPDRVRAELRRLGLTRLLGRLK